MDNKLSITAILIASLGTGVAVFKPSTERTVAATESEDDVMATSIVKANPTLELATCCKIGVVQAGEMTRRWSCADSRGDWTPDATQATWLTKKAGADGQCVKVDPKEIGTDTSVTLTKLTGDPIPFAPRIETIVDAQPAEKPLGEKVGP